MGSGESRETGVDDDGLPMEADYYALLGVDRSASAEEIRRAYKTAALKYHPDKNHEDEQRAAAVFVQIQTAYQVLSDEQERAWYDTHGDDVLSGLDPDGDDGRAVPRARAGLSVDKILSYCNPAVYAGFDDSRKGFFGCYAVVFGQVDEEEETACRAAHLDYDRLPSFGSQNSNDDEMRLFYSRWTNFATAKSFVWEDKWRYPDAPDRRVKRAMEKENKRLRDAARRTYNEAVRSLVLHVRKRDPRFKPVVVDDKQRVAELLAATQAQAARDKAAFRKKLQVDVEQEWTRLEETEDRYDEYSSDEERDDSVREEFECMVCSKVFKSEKQYRSHEQSKKHQKALQNFQYKMRQEGIDLGLDSDGSEQSLEEESAGADLEHTLSSGAGNDASTAQVNGELQGDSDIRTLADTNNLETQASGESPLDLDKQVDINLKTTRADVKKDLEKLHLNISEKPISEPKLGKAKQKRLKKALKKAELEATNESKGLSKSQKKKRVQNTRK